MAIAVLEHHDWRGWREQMAAGLLGSLGKDWQSRADAAAPGRAACESRGQRAFLFVFVLGDQELISSPSLGLSFLTCMVESYSCPAHVPRLFFSI